MSQHDRTVEAVLLLLAERWPLTFFMHERKRIPLKVGITADLERELGGAVTTPELHKALACYVANECYLKRCRRIGAARFNLAGKPEGAISERESHYAKLELAYPPKKIPSPTNSLS
jgi:sRNA-binding protein